MRHLVLKPNAKSTSRIVILRKRARRVATKRASVEVSMALVSKYCAITGMCRYSRGASVFQATSTGASKGKYVAHKRGRQGTHYLERHVDSVVYSTTLEKLGKGKGE